MTQKNLILEYLLTGATITPLVALQVAKSLRLSERIRELEEEGWSIAHIWQHEDGKHFMGYKIAIPHG